MSVAVETPGKSAEKVPVGHIRVAARWRRSPLLKDLRNVVSFIHLDDTLGVEDFRFTGNRSVILLLKDDLMQEAFNKSKQKIIKLRNAQRHGIRGIVVMERSTETQVHYAELQKLAVIELGLPVVPVRSLDEVPQLLSQMVLAEAKKHSNPYLYRKKGGGSDNSKGDVLQTLMCIPKLGERKAADLLKTFGSLPGIVSASQTELARVIGPALAGSVKTWLNGSKSHGTAFASKSSSSSNVVASALRPFYFAVHPDLFGKYPKERMVNENSLKQLNSYLNLLLDGQSVKPTQVFFYLRQTNIEGRFPSVSIQLLGRDVFQTVKSILQACHLPTDVINQIPETQKNLEPSHFSPVFCHVYDERLYEVKNKLRDITIPSLRKWLEENSGEAYMKKKMCRPVLDEIDRLKNELLEQLGIAHIFWNCGWGFQHMRGCLQSFKALAGHHPSDLKSLRGRTVIFGRETGISLDGHVMLSSGEVRHNWHDLIKNVSKYDVVLQRIPFIQGALSCSLQDIKVVHRRFQPTILADNYEAQLKKLITTLGDFTGKQGYPKNWPGKLDHLELVVETRREEEDELLKECIALLDLETLERDDNVSSEQMIHCCSKLLERASFFIAFLNGMDVRVTTYYSVTADGIMCLPWNWV